MNPEDNSTVYTPEVGPEPGQSKKAPTPDVLPQRDIKYETYDDPREPGANKKQRKP